MQRVDGYKAQLRHKPIDFLVTSVNTQTSATKSLHCWLCAYINMLFILLYNLIKDVQTSRSIVREMHVHDEL